MSNPWRVTSRPAIAVGTRGELIARAAAGQIIQNLAEQCALQDEYWVSRDQDWADITQTPYKRTRINVPQIPGRIFLGARPSLIESRFDLWPAITVRCNESKPSENREQPDQYQSIDGVLVIEILATTGPFQQDPHEDREISDSIDRQYQRLSDAVLACIDIDTSLNNTVPTLKGPPTVSPSLPFVRRQGKEQIGGYLMYQGAELRWPVTLLSR